MNQRDIASVLCIGSGSAVCRQLGRFRDRLKEDTLLIRPAPKRGLECPGCGCAHFRVLYTRRALGGRLLRRRECRHCGRRVTTYEAAQE